MGNPNDELDIRKQNDVHVMIREIISNRMNCDKLILEALSWATFEFLWFFNMGFCEKYSLEKKALTMRDIISFSEFCGKARGLCFGDLYKHVILILYFNIKFQYDLMPF